MASKGKTKSKLGHSKRGERKKFLRKARKFFLIVCEGEKTEPNYFRGLREFIPKGTMDLIIDIHGTGTNTKSLIERTIKIRKEKEIQNQTPYDETWAVFDKDDFNDEQFNNAIKSATNRKPPIHCAWSNEAFELWFLLHFNYYQNAMSRKQYSKLLDQEITKIKGSLYKYEKSNTEMYKTLKKYGDESAAIDRAKKLQDQYEDENFAAHNPCTLVYQLVEKLLELSSF